MAEALSFGTSCATTTPTTTTYPTTSRPPSVLSTTPSPLHPSFSFPAPSSHQQHPSHSTSYPPGNFSTLGPSSSYPGGYAQHPNPSPTYPGGYAGASTSPDTYPTVFTVSPNTPSGFPNHPLPSTSYPNPSDSPSMSVQVNSVFLDPNRGSKPPGGAAVRSHSLDQLNFEEKRQLIASTLSLSELLSKGPSKGKLKGEDVSPSHHGEVMSTPNSVVTSPTNAIITKTPTLSLSDILHASKQSSKQSLKQSKKGE
ncbi:unnamed protein product, partial [Meganyctiphanes norvegica]